MLVSAKPSAFVGDMHGGPSVFLGNQEKRALETPWGMVGAPVRIWVPAHDDPVREASRRMSKRPQGTTRPCGGGPGGAIRLGLSFGGWRRRTGSPCLSETAHRGRAVCCGGSQRFSLMGGEVLRTSLEETGFPLLSSTPGEERRKESPPRNPVPYQPARYEWIKD